MGHRRLLGILVWTLTVTAAFACDNESEQRPAAKTEAVESDSDESVRGDEAEQDETERAETQRADTKSKSPTEGAEKAARRGSLQRRPSQPDPHEGQFTLDEALEGLRGEGALVATIETSKGPLRCELFEERTPRTVANFVGLTRGKRAYWDAREGAWVKRRYYDGTTFHRVIPGFVIQGGDYLGNGTGTAGYEFDDEVHPDLKHDEAGLLCMANRGPDTNSAQFFITDGAAPHLDGSFSIFGRCEPLERISEIARAGTSPPVEIEKVRIERAPEGVPTATDE